VSGAKPNPPTIDQHIGLESIHDSLANQYFLVINFGDFCPPSLELQCRTVLSSSRYKRVSAFDFNFQFEAAKREGAVSSLPAFMVIWGS